MKKSLLAVVVLTGVLFSIPVFADETNLVDPSVEPLATLYSIEPTSEIIDPAASVETISIVDPTVEITPTATLDPSVVDPSSTNEIIDDSTLPQVVMYNMAGAGTSIEEPVASADPSPEATVDPSWLRDTTAPMLLSAPAPTASPAPTTLPQTGEGFPLSHLLNVVISLATLILTVLTVINIRRKHI